MDITTEEQRELIKNPGYELFILGLSVFSIINIGIAIFARNQDIVDIVTIVDGLSCIIFMGDFLYRLTSAPDRRAYLRWGWLDFLGSLPFPGLRLLRLVRVYRVYRGMVKIGGPSIVRTLLRDKAGSAVLAVFLVTIVVLEFAAILMVIAEGTPRRQHQERRGRPVVGARLGDDRRLRRPVPGDGPGAVHRLRDPDRGDRALQHHHRLHRDQAGADQQRRAGPAAAARPGGARGRGRHRPRLTAAADGRSLPQVLA